MNIYLKKFLHFVGACCIMGAWFLLGIFSVKQLGMMGFTVSLVSAFPFFYFALRIVSGAVIFKKEKK